MSRPRSRIMYIEIKADFLVGDAWIGRVTFSKSGRSIHYKGKTFQSLNICGFKANYYEVETEGHYWISGCKKNGEVVCMEKKCLFILMKMFRKSIG